MRASQFMTSRQLVRVICCAATIATVMMMVVAVRHVAYYARVCGELRSR